MQIEPLEPGWSATTFLSHAAQGQMRPSFFLCSKQDAAGVRQSRQEIFLLKTLDVPICLVREVLGNLIARQLGLHTPSPVIVEVPEEVAALANKALANSGRFGNVRSGKAAACEFVNLFRDLTLPADFEVLPDNCLSLFVFDMLAFNPDRTAKNPNCAVAEARLIVYDFEQCFDLTRELAATGPPWRPCQRGLASFHLLSKELGSLRVTEDQIQSRLGLLSISILQMQVDGFPESWKSEAYRILSHVEDVLWHADEFSSDLVEFLNP